MFHAISALLTRQARVVRDAGLGRDTMTAARHGWQARQIRPGTWQYRDPRLPHHPVADPSQPQPLPGPDHQGYPARKRADTGTPRLRTAPGRAISPGGH